MPQVWRIVGGAGKGGIVVRDGEGLKSPQLRSRLATGTLVEEVELRGSRMLFKLLDGCGPSHGWISLQVAGKELAEPTDTLIARSIAIHLGSGTVQQVPVSKVTTLTELKSLLLKRRTWTCLDLDLEGFKKAGDPDTCILSDTDQVEGDLEVVCKVPQWQHFVRAALRSGATDAQANEALEALDEALGRQGAKGATVTGPADALIHLARGLVMWKWHRFGQSLRALEAAKTGLSEPSKPAAKALLALQICLGRWPEAATLAAHSSPDAVTLVAGWMTGTAGHFSPSSAEFSPDVELRPGLRQIDARIPTIDDISLGVRLFLQMDSAAPRKATPLVLYFHGNAENVDTYKDPEIFAPFQAAQASVLVVDFRGYGFSLGSSGPSTSSMNVDAERVCDALPEFFRSRALPWPWPGGFFLFGRSMGGICACHLAGLRGDLFDGVVLESTMCGSHAPGAAPPPEPPPDGSGMGGGGSRFAPTELTAAVSQAGDVCRALLQSLADSHLQELIQEADLASFVHMMGSEDKLRGFTGRLLILHGELDTIIPVGHAHRLCDAAVSATRRLVKLGKGHNDISSSTKYVEALKKFLYGG